MKPTLSICIPSIPERIDKLSTLLAELDDQIDGRENVEVIAFIDNKQRSIGMKRESVKNLARGKYFTLLDDDDEIAPDYIDRILDAAKSNKDIITFEQLCQLDGKPMHVTFGLGNEVEPAEFDENGQYKDIKRPPFHCCVWKRSKVQKIKYADVGYGEDWHWCERALKKITSEKHIDTVLHYYIWDSDVTAAPTESNDVWQNPNE